MRSRSKKLNNSITQQLKTKIVVLSAKGKQFNQKMAADWARKYERLILISGRYEGIDERAVKALSSLEGGPGPGVWQTSRWAARRLWLSSLQRFHAGADAERCSWADRAAGIIRFIEGQG